jgi:hypothetical protein
MNNNSHHNAVRTIPNWRRLSVSMKARYGKWIVSYCASWNPHWEVEVTYVNGRHPKQQILYSFEEKADAEACSQWWKENNCIAVIRKI